MKSFLKKILPKSLLNSYYKRQLNKQYAEWSNKGKPFPIPHGIKQWAIISCKEKFGLDTLIETGTYQGFMVEVQKNYFKKIFSIELGEELFLKAKEKFKNDPHVTILHGDSGKVLPEVLKKIGEPCLLWLDGHYSDGITAKGILNTPIIEELKSALTQKADHVILIDDASLFVGQDDYPTVDTLRTYISELRPGYTIYLSDNIFYIHKK